MKHRLIIILLTMMTWGVTHATISFTDSITRVTLNLPDDVEITTSSPVAYKKLEANLPDGGTLSVYSVVNPKNETYSWNYLNNFDESYGIPREDVELNGDVNGRRRIYDFKTEKGTPFVRCVTIIRGVNYALYIQENAWTADKLISPQLVNDSYFPNLVDVEAIGGVRRASFIAIDYILPIILIALGIILRLIRKSLNEIMKYLAIGLFGVIEAVYLYMFAYFTPFASISCGISISFVTYLLLYCTTWDEFWRHLDNVVKNID